MFCAKCGKEIKSTVAFCPYCGAPQASSVAAASKDAPKEENPAGKRPDKEKSAAKKGKGGKAAVIIAAALAVAVAVGCVLYFTSDSYKCKKNMKLAEESYEAEEYEEALEYCDAAGNQTRYVSYRSDGSIYEWYEYEYDIFGNMIKDCHRGHTYTYEYRFIGEL